MPDEEPAAGAPVTAAGPVLAVGPLHEPLVLYSGALNVHLNEDPPRNVTGQGQVTFRYLPTPGPRWEVHDRSARHDESSDAVLDGEGLAFAGAVTLDSLGTAGRRIEGRIDRHVASPDATVHRVAFHVLNFPFEIGQTPIRHGSRAVRLRFSIDGQGWHITLDCVDDIATRLNELKRNGGFGVTHLGTLSRFDEQPFRFADGIRILDTLATYLSFVRGANVGVALPVGVDAIGSALAFAWASPVVKLLGDGTISWYPPQQPAVASQLFDEFARLSTDPHWGTVLPRVARMYTAANEAPIDRGLAVGVMALETLAWSILHVTERRFSKSAYDKLSTAVRLRELVQWAGVPTAIPARLTVLQARRPDEDGPSTLTWVRNRIVHADRKAELESSFMADGWLLSLWYLELVLLKLLGHDGPYMPRPQPDRYAWEHEPVPWGPPTVR